MAFAFISINSSNSDSRISYTEDDICSLLITDSTEADEAEYSCKAVNCEGEVEHRAELIVITPGA